MELLDIKTTAIVIPDIRGNLLVKISLRDGSIEYGESYTPDEAAKLFWEAIERQFSVKV